MIAVTSLAVVMVSVVIVAAALLYALFRLAVLANQVGMLQDWAAQVTYVLVAQEHALEVGRMRDRMQNLELELSELRDGVASESVPAEVS